MKAAFVMMGIVLVLLGIAVFWRGGSDALLLGLRNSGSVSKDFVPVLVLAILMMGFMQVLLPTELVETWLSDASGWRGIGIAWGAGVLTPAGSLVGLPIAAGLAKAGAGSGVIVTYLVSFATLSLIRIPMELGIIGPRLTILRIGACLFLPPLAGVLAKFMTSS